MSVVTFWNAIEKECGQTLSAIAIATYMAMEHNYRILLIDACFHDNTMEKAFWKKKENKALKELTGGKIDISSGAEGLISAVASNKATPEIITNYTRIVFKNRLDILLGLKTQIRQDHEKSMMLYKDLISTANKYYDIVFVDLSKGITRQSSEAILKISDVILYTMPPNLNNIDKFKELRLNKNSIVSSQKIMPLLARSDESSGYNVKNTSRYIKEKYTIATVPYNVRFMEATNEARTASFMTNIKLSKSALNVNGNFFEELGRTAQMVIDKIREVNK